MEKIQTKTEKGLEKFLDKAKNSIKATTIAILIALGAQSCSEGNKTIIVGEGTTITSIAKDSLGLDSMIINDEATLNAIINDIADQNNIDNPNNIKQGNKLTIDMARINKIIKGKESKKQNTIESGKADGIKPFEDKQYEEKYGVTLIRDHKLTFYKVKPGEGLSTIRYKLSQIDEFSYLSDPIYDIPNDGSRNTKGFNTPNKSLTPNFFLPIPQKNTEREITPENFKGYCKIALQEMKEDPNYGKEINEMISNLQKEGFSEEDIINIASAFARSETAEDYTEFSDLIGHATLSRRERNYKCYSFSYFHILMEKNADGKTPGPGLKARQTLGYTEGECYEPIKACKLFFAYCCEKRKSKDDPEYFFKIKEPSDAKTVGKTYNGGLPEYPEKLRNNIQFMKYGEVKTKYAESNSGKKNSNLKKNNNTSKSKAKQNKRNRRK